MIPGGVCARRARRAPALAQGPELHIGADEAEGVVEGAVVEGAGFEPTRSVTRPSGFQDHYSSESSTVSEQAGRKSIDRGDWTHPVYSPCRVSTPSDP